MRRLSPTTAVLVLMGLTAALWVALAAEILLGIVDSLTLAMAITFTGMMAAWPFLNGLRVTAQGPQQLAVCPECRRFVSPNYNFGFCIWCGAVAKPVRVPT
ncbi:MAG: hypothetical protein ACYDBQ_09960 [Thermoplasmatota archaeon]